MAYFDIFTSCNTSLIDTKLINLDYHITPIDQFEYREKPFFLFVSPKSYLKLKETIDRKRKAFFVVLVGLPDSETYDVSFILRENFKEEELSLALSIGRKSLLSSLESTFLDEKNQLIVSELSGNIHDIFSYLNNISARIQFLEMVIKENPHIDHAVELTIDQTRKMTKILRNLQIFSKSTMNPEEKSNIKVADLVENVMTLFNNRMLKLNSNFNISEIDDIEYFTGCNIDILFLYIASCFRVIMDIAKEKKVTLNANYSEDKVILSFRFTSPVLNNNSTVDDFISESFISKHMFVKLMNTCNSEFTITSDSNCVNIILNFPKGV